MSGARYVSGAAASGRSPPPASSRGACLSDLHRSSSHAAGSSHQLPGWVCAACSLSSGSAGVAELIGGLRVVRRVDQRGDVTTGGQALAACSGPSSSVRARSR